MAQANVELLRPELSVERTAAAINGMIAERAAGRLKPREPAAEVAPSKPHAPGVYFAMPAAEYHQDPSLGSTDVKRLVRDPGEFWHHSQMNPDRPASPDTEDKKEGRALHKLSLEGEVAFAKAFIEMPQPDAYPGCLITLDDLRGYCRDNGIKPESGPAPTTKAAFAKLIRTATPKVFIWDEILATFNAVAERDGLEILKAEAMRRIKASVASIRLNESLANAFVGGVPEVSVFWVDAQGIPCKARLDYLKPRTIVDLKKCDNAGERPFSVAVRLAIQNYRYDLQARHYLDGYRSLYQFAAEGRVFGDCPLRPDWGGRIQHPDGMRWTWIFRQTKGAPLIKGRELGNASVGAACSPVLSKADREIREAKETYLSCLERFGTSMWIDDEPVRELTEGELSAWMRDVVGEEYA